jgi:bifunctional non-homologous end joining protein LigD
MGKTTYLSKRDFSKTPEPRGESSASGDHPIFVIQEHHASTLHNLSGWKWTVC